MDALCAIGSVGLPGLLTVITNRKAEARFYAVTAIQSFGTNAKPAIPTLLLYRGDKAVAPAVYEALGRLKTEPKLVVPALERTARDPDPLQRGLAIMVVGDYGSEARPATPTVLAALSDTDPTVRDSATNALRAIAPEGLTNAAPQ